MKITAYFSDGGVPETGLTPTIDGWEIGVSQVITAQPMTEQAGGWYYYEYAGYDETKDYVFRCDGGVSLSGYDRYTAGTNRDDLEMSGKIPTNYFMGSSIAGDMNDEIDQIITDIGNLNDITSASVWAVGTKVITGGVLTTPNDYKATGFSTHTPAQVWIETGRELSTPANYKATGFSVPNEYDGVIAALQADLDNPAQYKATGFAPANEYDTELDVILSSRAPANEYDTELDVIVSSRAPASEYDTELTNLQSDVTDIKTKTDNLPTNTSDEIKRLLGIVDENSYCDLFTKDVSDRMTGCRKRTYIDKASADTHGAGGLVATYQVTVTYSGANLESYLMTLEP